MAKTMNTRKKVQAQQTKPRELRAAQIAAELPEDQGALLAASLAATEAYHAALIAGDVDAAEAASERREAIIWKLNGGSFFASYADPDSAGNQVEAYCRAAPGEEPKWGQYGEFVITVDGVRAVVEVVNGFGRNATGLQFHAIDLDRPFISETGFRSHFATNTCGTTVAEVARGVMRETLAKGDRHGIAPTFRDSIENRAERWAWLDSEARAAAPAPTVTYVEGDGQMAFAF